VVAKVLASFYLSDRIDSLHGFEPHDESRNLGNIPSSVIGHRQGIRFQEQSQELGLSATTKAIFRKTPLELFPHVSTPAQSSYAPPV
jgi:hypothetical protein